MHEWFKDHPVITYFIILACIIYIFNAVFRVQRLPIRVVARRDQPEFADRLCTQSFPLARDACFLREWHGDREQ